jgi:hypothetical protein
MDFWVVRMHQIIIDNRRPAASRLIMHVLMTFIELSDPFPHHSITHGIFTVHFIYLAMIVSRFHISCIQKTDYRPYFRVGGPLDRLKNFKRTEQNVNMI